MPKESQTTLSLSIFPLSLSLSLLMTLDDFMRLIENEYLGYGVRMTHERTTLVGKSLSWMKIFQLQTTL